MSDDATIRTKLQGVANDPAAPLGVRQLAMEVWWWLTGSDPLPDDSIEVRADKPTR